MRVASDEREHRRGLVLGLTMAEVLLLLLFLLLLALAVRLAHQARELKKADEVSQALGPLVNLLSGGTEVTPEKARQIAKDVANVPAVRKENEELKTALAEANRQVEAFKPVLDKAREFNPNDPPAALKLALDLLAKGNVDKLQARSDALSRLEKAADAIAPRVEPHKTIDKALSNLGSQANLVERSDALERFEKVAQGIDPQTSPQKTIGLALAGMQNARQAGADAKVGGQVRERVAVLRETEHQVNERLTKAFGGKLKGWGAELDPANMVLRFQRPDVLFETGSATLRPAFKSILSELFPEYIRILYEFKNDLEEVRIEGHTSSEWSNQTGEMQAYFYNMALSQDRTRAVLEYGLTETRLSPEQAAWARKLITANGLSSSRLREKDGTEDKEGSRRVDFRVLTRAKEQLLKIVDPGPL